MVRAANAIPSTANETSLERGARKFNATALKAAQTPLLRLDQREEDTKYMLFFVKLINRMISEIEAKRENRDARMLEEKGGRRGKARTLEQGCPRATT